MKAHSKKQGETWLGETPLSKLVCGGKGSFYRDTIFNLLDDDSVEDTNAWGQLWNWVPEHLESQAMALAATLGLGVACAYEFRMMGYFDSWHAHFVVCGAASACIRQEAPGHGSAIGRRSSREIDHG